MNRNIKSQIKYHALIAALVSLWLVFFLVFISPFDTSDLSFKLRVILLPVYGLIFFLSYMIGYGIQYMWMSYKNSWKLTEEIIIVLFIYLLCFFLSWLYYISDHINGVYSFSSFGLTIFLPIGLIFSLPLLFGRYVLYKRQSNPQSSKITILGQNQNEILKIYPQDIICISGAQNYVDIHIIEGSNHKKVVLRNTLKNIHAQCPDLIKVHRSYLVNSQHFSRWKDKETAIFKNVEVPIAKSFKKEFEKSISIHP